MEKEKRILSKIAVALLIIYYALGIIALTCQSVGSDLLISKENQELGRFLYHKIWDTLAPMLVLVIPFLCGIPNLIFCIVGGIKEKRVFPFILCVILPFFMWVVVMATATYYF